MKLEARLKDNQLSFSRLHLLDVPLTIMMNKEEWQQAYNKLTTCLSEFYQTTYNQKNSTEIEKKKVTEHSTFIIKSAWHTVLSNMEIFRLLVNDKSKYNEQADIIDSFQNINYFQQDLSNLVDQIAKKINSFDN